MQLFSHRGNNDTIAVLFWLQLSKYDNVQKTRKSTEEVKQEFRISMIEDERYESDGLNDKSGKA